MQDKEIHFILNVFIENGYDQTKIQKIITSFESNRNKTNENKNKEDYQNQTSYPWVPNISNKIKKLYKNLDIKCTFKSPPNLQTILCKKNKSKLPENSHPGVYKIDCRCGCSYIGDWGEDKNKDKSTSKISVYR